MKTPLIIRATQIGILALSLGSFAISFENIRVAAASVGTAPNLAIVYGLLAEGFISLATYTAWVARGTKLAWYPWFLAILGFSFSLWANARGSRSAGDIVIHSVPVIALPMGVHLLIVLTEAHRRRQLLEAGEPQPTIVEVPVEVERVVEVPAAISPETLDINNVQNPRAVAYKLLEAVHAENGNKQQQGYARKQWQSAMAA